MKTADDIWEAVQDVRDWGQVKAAAEQIVEQIGDLPEHIWYEMGFNLPDSGKAWAELQAMRPAGQASYTDGNDLKSQRI